jgi:hypothetical protein
MGCPSLISTVLDHIDSPPGEEAVKIAFVEPKMRLLEEQRLASHCMCLDFGIVSFSDSAPGKDGAVTGGKLLLMGAPGVTLRPMTIRGTGHAWAR